MLAAFAVLLGPLSPAAHHAKGSCSWSCETFEGAIHEALDELASDEYAGTVAELEAEMLESPGERGNGGAA